MDWDTWTRLARSIGWRPESLKGALLVGYAIAIAMAFWMVETFHLSHST